MAFVVAFVLIGMSLAVVLVVRLADKRDGGPAGGIAGADGPSVPIIDPQARPNPKRPVADSTTNAGTAAAPSGRAQVGGPKADDGPGFKKDLSPEILSLVKDLRAKDAKSRIAALNELREKGQEAGSAADAICDCLLDPSPKVISAAIDAIEKVRPDLYKPLSTLILDGEAERRWNAVAQLGALGEAAAPAKRILVAKLKISMSFLQEPGGHRVLGQDTADHFRVASLIEAIRKIDPEDEDAIKALKELAANHFGQRRYSYFVMSATEATEVLRKWAADDERKRKELLPILKAALESHDREEVAQALSICGDYGELAKGMLPKIKELKLSPDASTRDAAKRAHDKIESR